MGISPPNKYNSMVSVSGISKVLILRPTKSRNLLSKRQCLRGNYVTTRTCRAFDPRSPNQRLCHQKSKRISFNEKVRMKYVTSILELVDRPSKIWFQKAELHIIKKHVHRLATADSSGKMSLNQDETSNRGLERMSSGELDQVRRELVWNAVLQEQAFQKRSGHMDAEFLAEISRCNTETCRKEAISRGKLDAIEVQEYYMTDR